ncbi:dipeptide ABC transporter ATP-binding protein [Hyphococcus formosus]|uniref:ABC transporter ATP-binding protein n=1 Tax=Hyphococcus formosus TaxID=3143534 RepID=UPI00398AA222
MSLLEIKDLNVEIGSAQILKSVSLELDAGEIIGLVGESGSGKSMTAMSILGLVPPKTKKSGTISLDGEELSNATEKQLCDIRGRDIGIIFQEPMTALNPLMTIGDQIAETVRVHQKRSRKEALSIARDLLDRVGLPAPRFGLDRFPHDLSGGQRQRVAIAIALALKPKLIIADEPTTALDVTTQAEILDLLCRLVREDGAAMIFVTHDLAVIAGIADRIVLMRHGKIVEQGSVEKIFRKSENSYTRELIRNTNHKPKRNTQASSEDQPVLQVENLVREYSGKPKLFGKSEAFRAVNGVSLKIHPHENVGLVGESGCGKSTLLRSILGLDRAQAGRVRVDGEQFPAANAARTKELRKKIQVVFQDPFGSFDPRWRVEQIVAENFHLNDTTVSRRDARKHVEHMLEQVGLSGKDADRYPHQFSGGQRQRIAIARALITEPSIIALDEAVSALDVTVRATILDLLADLSDRLGVAYLFVTHDLTVVRSITDRVLVMQSGEIVEQGDTESVFANPQHPYTAKLLDAAPNLERALESRGLPRAVVAAQNIAEQAN